MKPVPIAVVAPELNPNDQEISVVSWAISPADKVSKGQVICQLETTKAVFDLPSDAEGYIYPACEAGSSVPVGSTIAWLLPEPNPALIPTKPEESSDATGSVLVSHQARSLMKQHGLTEADFPHLKNIRSQDIDKYLSQGKAAGKDVSQIDSLKITDKSLLIYGTGNHALVVLDTAMRAAIYSPCAFIDFSPRFDTFCQLPVFHESSLSEFYKRGVRSMHISLPDPNQELEIAAKAQQMGFNLVNIIDPTAVVSQSAQLGHNIFLGAQTIVGALSQLGNSSRVLNGASVAHHAKLGTGVRISDGARIAGNVFVDDRTLVGLGVTINFYLKIGKDCIVVSGASVFNDVPDSHVVRIDGNAYPKPN